MRMAGRRLSHLAPGAFLLGSVIEGVAMSQTRIPSDRSYALPPLGENPSTDRQGTTPGSFANPGRVGTPYTFSSPDTPGMPGVSDLTALDFSSPRDHEGKTQLEEARI